MSIDKKRTHTLTSTNKYTPNERKKKQRNNSNRFYFSTNQLKNIVSIPFYSLFDFAFLFVSNDGSLSRSPLGIRFGLHLWLRVFRICFLCGFFFGCCCFKLVKPRWNSCAWKHIKTPEKKLCLDFSVRVFLFFFSRLFCDVCFMALLCVFSRLRKLKNNFTQIRLFFFLWNCTHKHKFSILRGAAKSKRGTMFRDVLNVYWLFRRFRSFQLFSAFDMCTRYLYMLNDEQIQIKK